MMRYLAVSLLVAACGGKSAKTTTPEGRPQFATFATPATTALPCDVASKPGSGAIHGIVTARGSKEPIENVPIVAKGASLMGERKAISVAAGCYFVGDLPVGTYTIAMLAEDGSSSETTIEVRADAVSQLDATVDEARMAKEDVLAPRTIEDGAEVSKPPE